MMVTPSNPLGFLELERHGGWKKYNEMYENAGVVLNQDNIVYCVGPDHCQYYAFPAYSTLNYEVNNGELDIDEWKHQLCFGGYDYLIIEKFTGEFSEEYQDLFAGGQASIQEWTIYDIVVDGENVKFLKR